MNQRQINGVLITSITPYFLEKENVWFEQNLKQVLEALKTQSFFQDNVLYLEKNQSYNFSQFLRKLDEMGYEKVLQVQDLAEFSQRGGVVDVFPVNMANAARFEFLGNKIENIELLPVKTESEKSKEILKKRLKNQKLFSDLKGIKPGDYLVHLDHGVARFLGIENFQFSISNFQSSSKSPLSAGRQESSKYYILEYAQGDKLFIPVGLERKLSKYIGFSEPKISRLGSSLWQKTKKKIKEETERLAKELLEIYAKRETASRPVYSQKEEIQRDLETTFEYAETPDQAEAIEDIEEDMEKETEPMDRIVCGDVGFGKTEVGLRAIVKAAVSGRQSAMLCPTTILAHQHFQNFKERLKNLPIKIAMLSRLQTKKEQKETINKLKNGRIDAIVGTHRILSGDVEFKNLGLLVIDDEQRFGVKQKEKLKKMRAEIDVLSLSATPIPRTLYFALSSLKKISIIQTPPAGRLAVKTFVSPFEKETVKKAVAEELARKGQVYYLHNRIETVLAVKKFLEKLVPFARISVVHGRLFEKELIKTVEDFKNKKIDVLIATTIIENGIDLPNANTLIVDDASRLGLSQAHQIMGRVGRGHEKGFAYFLHPKKLHGLAKQRLDALKEAEELGSGYKIALKDLEIRGAGNILGKEQSGNVNRVGLNLYCQMLSETIEKLKTAKPAL